jgi:hypothetical protein
MPQPNSAIQAAIHIATQTANANTDTRPHRGDSKTGEAANDRKQTRTIMSYLPYLASMARIDDLRRQADEWRRTTGILLAQAESLPPTFPRAQSARLRRALRALLRTPRRTSIPERLRRARHDRSPSTTPEAQDLAYSHTGGPKRPVAAEAHQRLATSTSLPTQTRLGVHENPSWCPVKGGGGEGRDPR